MLPGQCLFLSWVPNVARPLFVFIMCTQCWQATVCFYLGYTMLPSPSLTNRNWPGNIGYTWYKQTWAWQHWVHMIQTDTGLATLGTQDKNRHWTGNIGYTQCLFLSCVPNVASPVSVFILCTQCCQASVCFYLVYPMLPGQEYTRYKQTLAWQHWVNKIKTDTGLATLGTHDTNRHWSCNIGYTWYKQTLAWQHWVHMIQTDTGLPVSVCILRTKCYQANVCLYLVYPMLPGPCLFVSCVPNVARPLFVYILCTQCCQALVCLYLVYPMLQSPCLFVSCVQTDMGLATLSTQDKNRH
jgi:hypothetical protein